jgi:TldD protein
MLEADPAPGGAMPVVLSAEAGGTMIHEAVGHGLEGDHVNEGMSVYAGRVGEQAASPLITVVDDGTLPGRRGSLGYDDEGVPSKRNLLIEKGVLKGFLHDRLSAQKMGAQPTGNGRRESYRFRPVPRMTNTMILPGDDDPQSVIRNTPHGLLVRKMGGGQVNTVNGDFVFEVSEGYLIKNGQPDRPVRGATLTGNGPKVLMEIDRAASDIGYSLGTCGKDGQGAPVADAQPTLRIPSMVVGGVQG